MPRWSRLAALMTQPAVGKLTAIWLLLELDDIRRFASAESWVIFLGSRRS